MRLEGPFDLPGRDNVVPGQGVSGWLLDEPNHRDDVRALRSFGLLAERWLGEFPDVPVVFRTDIGYIDFMRDLLAGRSISTVPANGFSL